jgi:hypothetical protein
MNELNSPSPTPDTVEDRELEGLLARAYDAPPMPRALLKRIDQVVEQEWGQSPRIGDTTADKLQRGAVRGTRWLRSLPIAAAVLIVVGLVAFTQLSSPTYAWSTMVDALVKAGLVEIESAGTVRWLSLSDEAAGEKSSRSTVLVDGQKNVILQCVEGATSVERVTLPTTGLSSRERVVLAFLMGNTTQPQSLALLQEGRIVDEQCRELSFKGTPAIELVVDLASPNDSAQLSVYFDAKTRLPMASEFVRTPSVQSRLPDVWSYHTEAREQVAAHLAAVPASLPIIDVTALTSAAVALVDGTPPSTPNASPGAAPAVVVAPAPPPLAVGEVAFHSNLTGAANQWKPVELHPSATGSRVRDLDTLLTRLWTQNQIRPVGEATPEELLRRVYLDLVGRTPNVTEVRSYLKDQSPDRYEQLVSRLLDSPDHASHLAAKFRSFLIPEGIDLTNFGGIEAFEKWLSEKFSSGQSYDQTVRELLLAEGRLVKSGPLLFYSATKLEPDQLAGRTARVFLGMRLECAQCHDHPFEPWKQEDFWGFAAFFGRISRPQGKLETVSTVMQVRDVARGEVMMPDSKDPVSPKFLNVGTPVESTQDVARRRLLTQWLTGKENPYFARATANRVWSMLFGKGIVNPVDDFGVGNPPISADLLDLLAGQFIQSNFDLKELFRTVALSRAYRLSSGAEDDNEARLEWFAQMNVKMLTAEQVYDCITVATMPGNVVASMDTGLVERFGNSSREEFLRDFRTPSGRSTEYQGGIPQALTLMNGGLVDGATGLQSSGLLKSLEAPFFSRDQRIEILYFATLARSPKASEQELLLEYIPENATPEQRREALSDVLWALLNSAEFTMNH